MKAKLLKRLRKESKDFIIKIYNRKIYVVDKRDDFSFLSNNSYSLDRAEVILKEKRRDFIINKINELRLINKIEKLNK